MGSLLIFSHHVYGPDIQRITEPPSLAQLNKLLGGDAEIVSEWVTQRGHQVCAMANKDGIAYGMLPNVNASNWIKDHSPEQLNWLGGYLVGPVAVVMMDVVQPGKKGP